MSDNPYPTKAGFGLRYHRAKSALEVYGQDEFSPPFKREFENCFEMFDGDAVVWALMHEAIDNKNNDLAAGIKRMGKAVWPHWMEVYKQEGHYAPKQEQLSLLLGQITAQKPKAPQVS